MKEFHKKILVRRWVILKGFPPLNFLSPFETPSPFKHPPSKSTSNLATGVLS